MKTSELTGMALDWAVAKCERKTYIGKGQLNDFRASRLKDRNTYSVSWALGGPIIERECIKVGVIDDSAPVIWAAQLSDPFLKFKSVHSRTGPTALISAMRCYVASRFGEEVEIPEELLK